MPLTTCGLCTLFPICLCLCLCFSSVQSVDFSSVDEFEDDKSVQQAGDSGDGAVPLTSCLDYFTSRERLTHDNMW